MRASIYRNDNKPESSQVIENTVAEYDLDYGLIYESD